MTKAKRYDSPEKLIKAAAQRSKYYHEHEKGTSKYKKNQFYCALKKNYGLSPDGYHALLRHQCGECAVCYRQSQLLSVDHDHNTGEVRGLICNVCNTSLGRLEKSGWLPVAESYLYRDVLDWSEVRSAVRG